MTPVCECEIWEPGDTGLHRCPQPVTGTWMSARTGQRFGCCDEHHTMFRRFEDRWLGGELPGMPDLADLAGIREERP